MTARLCAFSIAITVAGCGGMLGSRPALHEPRDYILASTDPFCTAQSDGPTLEAYIRAQVCWQNSSGVLHRFYAEFDEHQFDHLRAAMMLIDCTADVNEACWDDGLNDSFSPVVLGGMRWFATNVDLAAAGAEVRKRELPANAIEMFEAKLAAARQYVLDHAAVLDGRRIALYADLPDNVRARRKADAAALAEPVAAWRAFQTEVDPLVADNKPSKQHLAQAIAMRASWLTACMARDRGFGYCIAGPVGRPLTEDIVALALAAEDKVLAHAELALLQTYPAQELVQEEIYVAQFAEMAKEKKAYYAYTADADKLLDKQTLAATYGQPPPINVDPESAWGVNRAEPEYLRRISGLTGWQGYDEMSGKVVTVSRAGGRAVIKFADDVRKWDEGVGCHETNRITSVNQYGEVFYETRCKGYVAKTKRTKVNAIVPADEATQIRAGDHVQIYVDRDEGKTSGEKGHIVRVYADDKRENLVQIRTFRLDPP